jgi:hypothetical protein
VLVVTSRSPKDGDVIFEFHRIGAYVKVTAMDVATQTEISITGAANAPQEYLERLAREKLLRVIQKNGAR